MVYVSQKDADRDNVEYDVNACGTKQRIYDFKVGKNKLVVAYRKRSRQKGCHTPQF